MDRCLLRVGRNGGDRLENWEIKGRNRSLRGCRGERSAQGAFWLIFIGVICLLPAICRSEEGLDFFNVDAEGETKLEEGYNATKTKPKESSIADVFERVLDNEFPDKDPQEGTDRSRLVSLS